MSMFLIFFLYAVWTSSFAIGKMTLAVCPPIFLTSIRMLFAGMILFTFLWVRKREKLKILRSQLFPILMLSLFSIYLTNIFEFWGLKHLSSAKTCFIYSLSPFFAALFSFIHFKEKITPKKILRLSIGILGFIPVLIHQTNSEADAGGVGFFSWPAVAIAAAALCSVYGWVLLRLLVKDEKKAISPLTANSYSMLIGGGVALIHSLFVDSWSPLPIATGGTSTFLQGIFLMTFVSNILCYNLYGYLLKKYTATFLSFMGLLSPFFASFTGWIILGEIPSMTIIGSTAIVIIGLWIVYQEEIKQGYIKKLQLKTKQEA